MKTKTKFTSSFVKTTRGHAMVKTTDPPSADRPRYQRKQHKKLLFSEQGRPLNKLHDSNDYIFITRALLIFVHAHTQRNSNQLYTSINTVGTYS
jgi:hypothetical protein